MKDDVKADLDLYKSFEEMLERRLAEIPTQNISATSGWSEDVAAQHFSQLGFHVFHSRVRDGYRSLIDAAVHWHKLGAKDRKMVTLIRSSIPLDEYVLLVKAIRDKVGTPDLLLLKDNKLSFVEVKEKYELVKPCTIRFYLLYHHLWPISVPPSILSMHLRSSSPRTGESSEGLFGKHGGWVDSSIPLCHLATLTTTRILSYFFFFLFRGGIRVEGGIRRRC